jgi:invasion protein IalB
MIRRLAMLALFGLAAPVAAQEVTALPGGASSLTETHGAWMVSCTINEGKKDCALSQAVGNQSGQALVSLDLGIHDANRAEGMFLTAFGLRLDAGIQLGIDGNALNSALPFFTCLANGCVVPVTLDEVALSALRVGEVLEVTGINVETGEAVTVPISLTGFTAAYNRTAELSQ